jgi:subtilisin family serine protease
MLRTSNHLFYEVLERMTGPGRIFVTAAGNSGYLPSYVLKPRGVESAGCFLLDNGNLIRHQISANGPFSFQISIYADTSSPYIYKATTEQILEHPDSNLIDTIQVGGEQYVIDIIAFPNPFDAFATGYELTITGPRYFAFKVPFSLQVIGKESRVELLRMYGEFTTNDLNPALHDAVLGHHILAPASAPAAITVGSNAYITGHYNYLGEWKNSNGGVDGVRADMSSIGPTLDGLIKPDVMAPGQNIISSYSSYYLENHPQAGDITWDVEHFQYNGRTYPWNSNSGTSMACPVVAGVVALWLQACPTLTPDDVLHIIATTSTHPDATLTYPNNEYGYGQIDAAAGLRYIVSTAIRETPADTPARQATYNLMGQPVGSHYRGIVIRGGRKYTQK